ncbi:MAG: Holliday junction resolvase RuvX [Candidatus Omnitrophota bacterium]
MAKILCLDLGTKRIGVAISDDLGMIARALTTIERGSDEELFETLKRILKEESAGEIVIGLPLNMDGSHGPKAMEASSFAETLEKKLDRPVKLWDERMSTMEAERVMIEADTSRRKRKRKIDKLAACVILQSYLNAIGNKL